MPFAHRILASAFGEEAQASLDAEKGSLLAEARASGKSHIKKVDPKAVAEDEPPDSKAAEIDKKVEEEKEAGEMPVEKIEVKEPPNGLETDNTYDPRIPRKLTDKLVLRNKGAWDMRPYGLRTISGRLFACDTDDSKKLQLGEGRCGLVGTRWQIDGISLYNKATGMRVLPVKRFDELRNRWTSEDAPYIRIPEWKLPRAGDGYVDFSKIAAIPRTMTMEAPGETMSTVEGSAAPLLPLAVACTMPKELRAMSRHHGRDSCSDATWKERCRNFL